jgi:hypothetical protein
VSVTEPLGSEVLAYVNVEAGTDPRFFNPDGTVISQYANSPILLGLIDALSYAIDKQAAWDSFYEWVWDVEQARGFGLDILGRIVGVQRALYVPDGQYLGWSEATGSYPFGSGVFYQANSATPNFNLTDVAFRRVILAKAALNITDCSIPAINAILMALFPGYGNVYVRDNADMTMGYVFSAAPSKIDYAIATQSGCLPKPCGVAVVVEQP